MWCFLLKGKKNSVCLLALRKQIAKPAMSPMHLPSSAFTTIGVSREMIVDTLLSILQAKAAGTADALGSDHMRDRYLPPASLELQGSQQCVIEKAREVARAL